MEPKGVRRPEDYAGVCGTYWEGCGWYEALPFTCVGHPQVLGHSPCPVRSCAAWHRVENCALCVQFPCPLLFAFAARTGDDLRIFSAMRRAEYGDEAWASWAREQLAVWVNAYCPLRSLPDATGEGTRPEHHGDLQVGADMRTVSVPRSRSR